MMVFSGLSMMRMLQPHACLPTLQTSGQTLQQMQICLDKKDFKVMNCPLPKSTEGFCWSSETIHYIPSKYTNP